MRKQALSHFLLMPEIAEVEVLRRQLQPLVSAEVSAIKIEDVKLKTKTLLAARGRVLGIRRRGKLLGLELEGGRVLACHLRMTGALTFTPQPHTRARIEFADGRSLYFSDPRRFGIMEMVAHEDFAVKLGPDLLDDLKGCLAIEIAKQCAIKNVLLDQSVIAGIGNYMADETLFACRTHPLAPASLVDWPLVCETAHEIAKRSLELGGVSLRDYKHADGESGHAQTMLRVYGRANAPCLVCGTALTHVVVGGRGTTFCRRRQQQVVVNAKGREYKILPERNYYERGRWWIQALEVETGKSWTLAVSNLVSWRPAPAQK
jgi:formamidopyrimidine-DNA glycosylase